MIWRRMIGIVLSALVLIGVCGAAYAQIPGRIDPTFNAGGSGAFGTVIPVHMYPDGRILVRGTFTSYNGITRSQIARLNADGTLDESFDAGRAAQTYMLHGVRVLPDGRVLAYGSFTFFNDKLRIALARMDENGALDESFDAQLGNATITNVALQADGKIVAAGDFAIPGDPIRRSLVRLNSDGTIDRSFQASLTGAFGDNALAIQPDGKVLVGGSVRETESGKFTLFRLQRDGSIDREFSPVVQFGTTSSVYAIAVQPNGKIVIAGTGFIRRLESGGTDDATFQTSATATYSSPKSIVIQPDGKLLLAGSICDSSAYNQIGYARLNSDGSRDTGFDVGPETREASSGLVLASNGNIIVSGPGSPMRVFGGAPSVAGAGVARVASTSYLVNESNPAASVAIVRDGGNSEALTLNYSVQPGTAATPSDFTSVSGTVTFNTGEIWKVVSIPIAQERIFEGTETFTFQVAAANAEPSTATVTILDDDQPGRVEWRKPQVQVSETGGKVALQLTRNGETTGAITIRFATIDGSAVAGSDFALSTGTVAFEDGENLKTVEIPVYEDQTGEGAEAFTVSLNNPTDGAILGEAVTATVILTDNASPGTVLPSFTKGSADSVSFLIPSLLRCATELPNGRLLIGGRFDSYAGIARRALVMLNSDGTVDESFPSPLAASAEVWQILLQPDGKILVRGTNLRTGNTTRADIVRLNSNGSLDETFNPGLPNGVVNVIALQLDAKIIVAGNFNAIGGGTRTNIARLNPDGSLDTSFAQPDYSPSTIAALVVQPDGRILFGGDFSPGTGRLHPGGERDTEYLPDPLFNPFFTRVKALALQPDGYILVGGELAFKDQPTAMLLRLTPSGAIDPTFTIADRPFQSSHSVDSIVLQENGSIVVSGTFTDIGGIARAGVAQLFADGTGDQSFASELTGASALAMLANGHLLVTTTIGGKPQLNQFMGGHLKQAGDSVVHFTWTNVGVNEGRGETVLNVLREGGNLNAVSVVVRTEDGTAKAGKDYDAIATSISFAAHEITKQVRIPVFENVSTEGSRRFSVELSNPSPGAVLGTRTKSIVTIEDNELPGRFQLESPTFTVRESSAALMVRVKRALGDDGRVTVDLKTASSNATAGEDFNAVNTTVVFEPGVTEQVVQVPIIKDALVEGNETFSVALSNATGGAVLSPVANATSALVTLIDIDDPGSLDEDFAPTFETNSTIHATAVQEDGKLVIAGTLNPASGVPGRIIRLLEQGTPDPQFTPLSLNTSRQAVLVQPDGKILIAGGYTRIGNAQFPPIARLNADGTLDNSFIPPTLDDTATIYTLKLQSDGKILIGGSFSTIDSQPQATLARLEANGAFDRTYRPIIQLPQYSSLKLLVTPEDKVVYVGQQHRLYQLLPDGTIDPGFNAARLSWTESSNHNITCIALDPRGRIMIGGSFDRVGSAIRKDIARLLPDGSVDTSFDAGNLFTSPPDAMVVQADERIIAGGYVQGSNRRPIVRLFPDGEHDVSFRIENTLPVGHIRSMQVLPNNTVLVEGTNSLDDVLVPKIGRLLLGEQPGTFKFKNVVVQVPENATSVSLTVERFGGADGEATVAYYTEAGTAQPGTDYNEESGELVFPPGVTTQTIPMPIVNNSDWDQDRTFFVRLGSITGNALVAQGKDKVVVTIENDDPPIPGTLQFVQPELTVTEGTASVTLVVQRVGGSDSVTEVEYRTADGEAKAGFDFASAVGTLRFEDGETTKEIHINLLENSLRESPETFTVALIGIDGATVGSTSIATVTITDSDVATIGAFRGTYRGLVHRNNNLGGAAVVSLLGKGTATATVILDGRRYTFRGKFDPNGVLSATVPVKNGSPINLRLRVEEPGAIAGRISGHIEIGGNIYALTMDKAPYNTRKDPAPMAGSYKCVFQAVEGDESTPRGHGIGNVTVAKNGAVRLIGSLADGARISQSTNVASDGSWALFLPLYKTGGLSGIAQFTETAQAWDFSGNAYWLKPERSNDRHYSAGFSTQVAIVGSPMPAKGAPMLDFVDGKVSLNDGIMSLERDLTITGGKRISLQGGSERLQLSLDSRSGVVNGSFIPSGASRAVPIRGIILPDENRAVGFFIGPNGSGSFRLEQRIPSAN